MTGELNRSVGAPPQDEGPDRILIEGQAVRSSGHGGAIGRLLLDRGLHYGDGLFETIACLNGRLRLRDFHLERLALGCARLQIPNPPEDDLVAELEGIVRGTQRALVKLLLTRGAATSRGYAAHGDERSTRVVLRYPWPQDGSERARAGVPATLGALRLGENPQLAGIKHVNRLEQVLARTQLNGTRFTEALLLDTSERLVSGTMTNVFLVRGAHLTTPRLDRCGVAGVMRRAVMAVAVDAGIAVEEATLRRADLESADEIFLTNARIGIWPVRELDGREYEVGAFTRQLQRLLDSYVSESLDVA